MLIRSLGAGSGVGAHGTKVAGEITAKTEGNGQIDTSEGIAAVAPSTLVLPIRLNFIEYYENSEWVYQIDYTSIVKAVHALAKTFRHGWWAEKVRVINMSFGGPIGPGAVELAIQTDVLENDRLYVASAGNDASSALFWPAAYSGWVLGVSGLIWDATPGNQHWKTTWEPGGDRGSNYWNDGYQTYPVSGVYGVDHYETYFPTRSLSTESTLPYYGTYDNFSGTSPCAAQVSGLAALMYHNRPNRQYWLVMNYISAYRDHSTDQHGEHQIAGLADFDATLQAWGKDPGR